MTCPRSVLTFKRKTIARIKVQSRYKMSNVALILPALIAGISINKQKTLFGRYVKNL